jgi:hypothetical protein
MLGKMTGINKETVCKVLVEDLKKENVRMSCKQRLN